MSLPVPKGRQGYVIYMAPRGHLVVLGAAGTGKTVMALHRAVHLADRQTENGGPTLLTTHSSELVRHLISLDGARRPGMTIASYSKFAGEYLRGLKKMLPNAVIENTMKMELVDRAARSVGLGASRNAFFDSPPQFFVDELEWIDGQGLDDEQDYLDARRVGRTKPLQVTQRSIIWEIREVYRDLRARKGFQYEWSSLPNAVLESQKFDDRPRQYRHIVVDESQDLSPQAIRSLVAAVTPGGSVTLFADYAQQIYGQRVSWLSIGLKVNKSEKFTDNYRNTQQIAAVAFKMAQMPHFKDSPDLITPTKPTATGSRPALMRYESYAEECRQVCRRALQESVRAPVVILVRTSKEATSFRNLLQSLTDHHGRGTSRKSTVSVMTYYAAKGQEFDTVFLPGCTHKNFPDSNSIDALGEPEAMSRSARLIYVGVTRARRKLFVSFSGELTTLLPPPSSDVWDTRECQ